MNKLLAILLLSIVVCDQIDEYCEYAPWSSFCSVKHDDPSCVDMGYMHNEARNPIDLDDNLRCINDCQCDGIRKCVDETKVCETKQARSEEYCVSEKYHIEKEKRLCKSNCDCDGRRFCKRYRCTDPVDITI